MYSVSIIRTFELIESGVMCFRHEEYGATSACALLDDIQNNKALIFDCSFSNSNRYKGSFTVNSIGLHSLWRFYTNDLWIDYHGIHNWIDLGLTAAHKILDYKVFLRELSA